MFEISSKTQDEVVISTKKTTVGFNVREGYIEADLKVGKITGPGEFEVGDVAIRGIATESGRTIYDAEIGGVHVGVVGDSEENLDDLVAEILCTSSVRAVREIAPKLVVATGNVDGMVTELKLTPRIEKRLKIKNESSLPQVMEVVVLQ